MGKMQEVFSELGYSFSWKVLNAKNYGIPQNRERLFVVGFRDDLKLNSLFDFPSPIELKKKMKDFLMDNAPGGYFLPKKGVEFVTKEKNLEKRFTQIDGDFLTFIVYGQGYFIDNISYQTQTGIQIRPYDSKRDFIFLNISKDIVL